VAISYHGLVKRLDLPAGWMPPAELEHDDIRARAISRADLHDDVRGINASIALIRRTRGGRWPAEPVSEDFNFVDLVWHECEFREGDSFTYAVYDSGGHYLGCCYLYPMGRRNPPHRGTARLRRRRELVGHARCVRARLLRQAVRRAAALDRGGIPVREGVLLQRRDPPVTAESAGFDELWLAPRRPTRPPVKS
jgi:hypothetical protein